MKTKRNKDDSWQSALWLALTLLGVYATVGLLAWCGGGS